MSSDEASVQEERNVDGRKLDREVQDAARAFEIGLSFLGGSKP